MTIKTKTNGYDADGIQKMLGIFNKAAEKLFPECEVEHFYYGDNLIFSDIRLGVGHYGHFSITAKEVHFSGYECSKEELMKFQSLTHNDWLYKNQGRLLEIARA